MTYKVECSWIGYCKFNIKKKKKKIALKNKWGYLFLPFSLTLIFIMRDEKWAELEELL